MSMYNFDEVSGVLSMVSNFVFYWKDEYLKWNKDGNGLPGNIVMNKNLIWVPEIATFNSAETNLNSRNSDEKETVRVHFNGQIHYRSPAKVLKTLCTPNMEYYPIDEHTCIQQVFIRDYFPYEVRFGPSSKLILDQYQNSSTWDVKEWKLSRGNIVSNSFSCVTLTVVFKRKPFFILINIISPVLLLSVINVFVFGLPVVSGERISYAMTTFLSLAVYMTIIAEKLPDGNPVPMFTYFVVGKLVYSSLIILCTIIGLQLHHGKESFLIRTSVSLWAILRRLTFTSPKNCFAKYRKKFDKRRNKITVVNVSTVDISPLGSVKSSALNKISLEENKKDAETFNKSEIKKTSEMKWKRCAKIFDRVCLVVFLLIVISEIATWVVLTWFA